MLPAAGSSFFSFPVETVRDNLASSFMRWIAPSEEDTASATLEKRLWDAADQFRANSGLKFQEYSATVRP